MLAAQVLLPPLLLGLVAAFFLEQTLRPRPAPCWQRPSATFILHIGIWTLTFTLLLALVQRPWFAGFTMLAFQLLLVLVNQAKFASLREPFIFQDFEYFTHAIKHPRLYLPFFGIGRTIAATFGFTGALIIGLSLEMPLLSQLTWPVTITSWLILLTGSLFLTKLGLNYCPTISLHPAEDLYNLGQIGFLAAYWHAEKNHSGKFAGSNLEASFSKPELPIFAGSQHPHIIAVQSESFFDPRPLSDNIKDAVLSHFDALKNSAYIYGRLQVPAWGANTVRTESGFLTGLTPSQLGIHRFNPYRLFAKHSVPNLAGFLKQQGYQTICIHPYPASFYQRNQVFPRLGFDLFLDIDAFSDSPKTGQFIGDLTVAEKITGLLRQNNGQPLFIFVITMENHGPLHLEAVDPNDQQDFYHQPPPPQSRDLTVYLKHLKNADLMIGQLQAALSHEAKREQNNRSGVLCWYGDHLPIMPEVYQHYGEPDGLSDYFIWHTASQTAASKPQTLDIHNLAASLLTTPQSR